MSILNNSETYMKAKNPLEQLPKWSIENPEHRKYLTGKERDNPEHEWTLNPKYYNDIIPHTLERKKENAHISSTPYEESNSFPRGENQTEQGYQPIHNWKTDSNKHNGNKLTNSDYNEESITDGENKRTRRHSNEEEQPNG